MKLKYVPALLLTGLGLMGSWAALAYNSNGTTTISSSGTGGAVALISTISAPTTTGCGSINCFAWTGLTADKVELKCHGLIGGNATQNIGVQFGTGAGPTWQTGAAAYTYAETLLTTGGAGLSTASGTVNGIPGPFEPATSGNAGADFSALIQGLTASGAGTQFKQALFRSGETNASANQATANGMAFDNTDTVPITAVRVIDIQATPVSIASGSCSLYSVAD